ncbi:uncharacterized protein LOC128257835 [Drosophila gunungcola]|uniref:uncharacterized protein LOC128257835 n=1 Tax=Drosophila gunungcola TaxID=103775 RepID=UPI0022DF9F19|nr:uncharacterized protein LOC128257835 [Drosophila gunungcola]
MSYGFIPLNSFGELLLLLLQEEPRGSSLWKTTNKEGSKKQQKGRRNHKVVLNKLKKRIGEKRNEKAQTQSHS